jgi:hypothetical protein
MSAELPPRPALSSAAVVSLALGLLSPLLSLIAAVPAFLVGLRALRDIHRSDGRLRGAGLAVAGMALGALAGVATTIGLGVILISHLHSTRERVECANHLRAVGLAVRVYHDQHDKTFPAATVAVPLLPPEERLSWQANLLPYVGGNTPAARPWKSLSSRLHPREPWDSAANAAEEVRIPLFLCPASPAAYVGTGPGLSSYVGLAGIDPAAATLPLSSPRAGLFGYDRAATDADLVAGASHTLMATETGQDNGPWAAGGPPTVRGVGPDGDGYLGPGRPFGGLHAGGGNALYADAAVHFLRDTMVGAEFRAEATLVGRTLEGPE